MTEILTGLISGNDMKSIYKKKKSDYEYLSVKKGKEDAYIDDGWTVHKEYKTRTKLCKLKPIGSFFEDKVWCIFFRMGFNEMNKDNKFKIPIYPGKYVTPKQIDVFAKDEESVILVECKAANNPTNRSFRKDINEINGIRQEIITSINKHYGSKLKVGWIFATKNIIWSDSDLQLAQTSDITVLRDDELEYYEELVEHIGPAAKYQLLAEVFANKKIPNLQIKVPAIKGKIGGATFYSFAIEPSKLLAIAFVSHRLKTDRETVITYQRMLNKRRLKSIREYIEKEGGLFPNSIIINFRTKKGRLRFDKFGNAPQGTEASLGILHLPGKYKSAWIIDGQHRLYGFSGSEKADMVTIPIIAFENLDAAKQARMFIDINSKQVKVPRNLLEDLYSDLLWDSDDEAEKLLALTSKVVNELGKDISSPLYNKIKPSTQVRAKNKPITIATLTSAIKSNKLLGQVNKGANILRPGPLYDEREPRMENSLIRAKKILIGYFNAFRTGVPENWELGAEDGGYLCTNNALVSLLIVLKEIIFHIEKTTSLKAIDITSEDLIEEISRYIDPVVQYFKNATYDEIRNFRRQLGAAGQKYCAYGMMEMIYSKYPDFKPAGLDEYIREKYSTRNEEARNIVPQIQLLISRYVISTLKEEFGVGDEKWWYEGVPENVRIDVVKRQEKDPEHRPKEENFDLIHYLDIISKNWDIFKEVYGFKDLGNSKIKQLSWFKELNRIRNKVAHPERGKITEDELKFIKELYKKLEDRINNAHIPD